MRMSLWLLLAGALVVSVGWVWLVILSGFEIWRESNAAGLALQSAIVLLPLAVFLGLKNSKDSFTRTAAVFAVAWPVAIAGLLFFHAR
jgi:hypothetical protein